MATFYIEAVEATTITLDKVGSPTVGTVKYGVNDPSCPYTYTQKGSQAPAISLTAGQRCYWTITKTTVKFSETTYLRFTSTGSINVGGNLSDLIGGETTIPRNYCFANLFQGCTKLVDASNLIMISDFGSNTYCYYRMFADCTSLTVAPELPATTLANYCYQYMFRGCTSLTTPPELPATTLAASCYNSMFRSCASLKLSTTQIEKYKIPYRIPSSGTGTTASMALNSMFSDTGGTFTGNPSINTTYYLWKDSSDLIVTYNGNTIISDEVETPCIVSYKGQTLVSIDANTTKTLNCNGKYMEDNVGIGDKTLNCAGKVMASDVVVEVT